MTDASRHLLQVYSSQPARACCSRWRDCVPSRRFVSPRFCFTVSTCSETDKINCRQANFPLQRHETLF